MDCTAKCRLGRHADVVLSAVTRESLQDVKCFVKYFCASGTRARDRFGRNALHMAASCGRKDVLQWLLEEGFLDVGEKDWESGWTALHRACYYGKLSCALLLIQHGANMYEKDFEGLSPIEILMFDSPQLSGICAQKERRPDTRLDIYSCGRNSNFTLGHGDDKERKIPEAVDVFARMIHISIQEVVICKFHAVFRSGNGRVWTCGHGLGGRLGHGQEETILVPKKIDALSGQFCTGIAAGQDHTVVLCDNCDVFTFGLNKYHQMGHHPIAEQYLEPKLVMAKNLKGKKFVGVAAGKFHTLVYTETEVYSWGLNGGQLGHMKGERTQVVPRQVSGLHLKDTTISSVTCCDAATVCLTNHGDVYLVYQYAQRKIVSRLPNIAKLVVTGGQLDDNHFKGIKEEKFGPLTIYGLYGEGYVFQWRESDKCLRDCRWTLQKPLSVRDIACGKSLHIATAQGEVYTEDGSSASERKATKVSAKSQNVIKTNNALRQDEVVQIPLTRVQHAHRAVSVVSDKYSQNFAILEADPSFGCSTVPHVSPPEINKHLRRLLEDVNESYDVEIKVKGKILHAHQVVLAQGSEKLRTMMNNAKQESCSVLDFPQPPIIIYLEENFEIIQEIIEFLYTGCCASLAIRNGDVCVDKSLKEREMTDEDMLKALALSLQEVDFDILDVPQHAECEQVFKHQPRRSKSSGKGGKNKDESSRKKMQAGELGVRKKELLRVAKKYHVAELISLLQDSSNDVEVKHKGFYRSKLSEYCDVVIEAEDGVEFSCHKCILVSRLEYFSIMLTTGWMESSGDFVRLKMPIPSCVLRVIIEFLYTDEAPSVTDSSDLEFLGKVLTVADQFWIVRLRELCEATLASLISLKNAAEMLEFSCLYNAGNLKCVCLEFVCMNISCLFEAGSLEMLSEDVMDEVSKVYQEMIPRMSWRVITPSDVHLSVPCPQAESPSKRKSKSSRSQRRSRSSDSDAAGEDRAAQGSRTEVNEEAEKKIEIDEKLPKNERSSGQGNSVAVAEMQSENVASSQDALLNGEEKVAEKITKTGTWYQKHGDNSPTILPSIPSLTTKKALTKTATNPLPVSARKNGEVEERQPWGSSSFSPQSSNLQAIMEQEQSEQKMDKSWKELGKSPGKTRLSQKERKKMRKSAEELQPLQNDFCESPQESNEMSTSPVTVNPWNNFSPLSKPSVSFRELLEQEENLGASVVCSPKKKSTVEQNVSNDRAGATSAWQHQNIACSPPTNSCMKLDKIQELQEQETANRERDMKKPLSLIQIEDKAIEQLLEHYGGRYNPCEYIVVERETRNASSPDWVK